MNSSNVTEWLQALVIDDRAWRPSQGPLLDLDYIDEMGAIRSWPEFIAMIGRATRQSIGDLNSKASEAQTLLTDPDVLLIDFNFEQDPFMPEVEIERDEYRKRGWSLRWAESLGDMRTSGLLIGATLAGQFAFRDFPLTTAVYTGYPGIVEKDAGSLFAVAQILALGGTDFQMSADHDYLAVCEQAVDFIRNGPDNWTAALLGHGRTGEPCRSPLGAYRDELNRRAVQLDRPFLGGPCAPRLTIDIGSLDCLLLKLESLTDETELNVLLDQYGLDVEDNSTIQRRLDLRSLFLDLLANPKSEVVTVPLDMFQPEGVAFQWLKELAENAIDNKLEEVMDLILTASLDQIWSKGKTDKTFLSAVSQKRYGSNYIWYQLWAIMFAWVDAWCTKWLDHVSRHGDVEDTADVSVHGMYTRWLQILGCTSYGRAPADVFEKTLHQRDPTKWLKRPKWEPRARAVCRRYIERKRDKDCQQRYPIPDFLTD